MQTSKKQLNDFVEDANHVVERLNRLKEACPEQKDWIEVLINKALVRLARRQEDLAQFLQGQPG